MSCDVPSAIQIVIGSKLDLPCTYTEDGTTPINLTGYTIDAYIRTQDGALVDQLSGTITSASAGTYTLAVDATGWPEGTHRMDIRYSVGGHVSYTSKALVECTRPETETRTGD